MKNKYSYVLNSIFKIIVILLLPNSINAQFGSPFVIDSANNTLVNTINIVDLDNDNQKDILVSNLYDSVYWYKNNRVNKLKFWANGGQIGGQFTILKYKYYINQ